MGGVDGRLIRCFEVAFEGLAVEDIPSASIETVSDWDSLQALLLFALLEEEFELRIPLQAFAELRSFDSVRDYVRRAIDR